MGIPWFSMTMIGAHAVLFNDAEYLGAIEWAREWQRAISARPRSSSQARGVWGLPAD